jgi:hypothetical protein
VIERAQRLGPRSGDHAGAELMEKKSEWPLQLAVGLFVTVLVVIVFWQPLSRGLCPRDDTFFRPTFSQNCFDFLLNRYQTLITGIFTLLTAIVAWISVWRQLKQSEKLATRDGRHSARAITSIFRKYAHAILKPIQAKSLPLTESDLRQAVHTTIRNIKMVEGNIDSFRSRLFSDDLADVMEVNNLLAVFRDRLTRIDVQSTHSSHQRLIIRVINSANSILNACVDKIETRGISRDRWQRD